MKIKVIKQHPFYSIGEHDVEDERGNYLINAGIAEKVEVIAEKEKVEVIAEKEKVEVIAEKEKVEKTTKKK